MLLLEDGSVFRGKIFGARKKVFGEVVFNTGMVGYTEALTDPSYTGQILASSYPLIGNYGVPQYYEDKNGIPIGFESKGIKVAAYVVSELCKNPSHSDSKKTLEKWFIEEDKTGIERIDTRRLVKILREHGCMMGVLCPGNPDIESLTKELKVAANPNSRNLVADVSPKSIIRIGDGSKKAVLIDCGAKSGIVREILKRDVELAIVPYNCAPEKILEENPECVIISNGPGNPKALKETIASVKKIIEAKIPVFGVCLGNQILALALGADTYKLKYGHRSQNQPCKDLFSGRTYITTQNHGYAVDEKSLPKNVSVWFVNANDRTVEGIVHNELPCASVQFHPEAMPGPNDTAFLFDKFFEMVENKGDTYKNCGAKDPAVEIESYSLSKKIKKVLVLGSGALKIGEAGEFDFSGSQALKALREAGIETVLVNPNIATIQTDTSMASKIYLLPVEPESVERVIKKERPDSILLNVGGQTALNCGVALCDRGMLSKYNISVLGTSIESIRTAEDRRLFKQAMEEAGLNVCRSAAANSVEEAIAVAKGLGYPVMIRSGFTLGGAGSGVAKNEEDLRKIADVAIQGSPIRQILIEEYVGGWKEIEYEIMRDRKDNCIIICNMENFDPMGIHTGESIVVAPSQTLDNTEYHALRSIAIDAVRKINIVGECNIQFAVRPDSFDYRIIEVNPRLSRSSALASKATGYPIASVATKICIGKSLDEIKNPVTQATYACFEPALDYVVVKIPRWDFKKFRGSDRRIGTQMKSVGEVMAIGRNFEEAIQKAVRMCDPSKQGVVGNGIDSCTDILEIEKNLAEPTDLRLFYIAAAIKSGISLERIHELSKIDPWFLNKIKNIAETGARLKKSGTECLLEAKKLGFSDEGIAKILGKKENEIRKLRIEKNIIPHARHIDTLAAEWPSKTNYLYLTYGAEDDDIMYSKSGKENHLTAFEAFQPNVENHPATLEAFQHSAEKVIVLGSGPYSIGSSVEFDWCSVHGVWGVKKSGKEAIMINCNPETVSTDYDISDKLYFEDINLETVLDIAEKEKPLGIIVSFGGQRPNNIALKLHEAGMRLLGTAPENIDRAEDRSKFSALLDRLEIKQPAWSAVEDLAGAEEFARNVKYPVIVRPSYVLSGAAMKVVHSEKELETYIREATEISSERPVVISKFISNAREIEVDGVSDGKNVLIGAIAEHIENAGVHSGDATIVIPTRTVKESALKKIRENTEKIAGSLQIKGPFNIQYLVENGDVYVIECNLRASRSMPFVSKTVGLNIIEIATNIILGQKLISSFMPVPKHYGIKVPQFSFMRIGGADPLLGIEMASTGEVACIGTDFAKTLIDAMRAAEFRVPVEFGRVLISASDAARPKILKAAKMLSSIGFEIYATSGTSDFLKENSVDSISLKKISEERPNILDHIMQKKIDAVINIPHDEESEGERQDGYILRRATVNYGIPLITNPELAHTLVLAIKKEHEKSKLMELGTVPKTSPESLQGFIEIKGAE